METPRNPDRLSPDEFKTALIRGLYQIPVSPDSPKDDPFLRQVDDLLNSNAGSVGRVIDPNNPIYRNDWLPRAGKWARR